MQFSEYNENQENRPHSGKKHVELSTHNVKSGLVSSITGLTPRASHGGLLSPRHPNINACAVNNQMKESVAEVDVRGVTHARRHTQPVEHEPALNITMSPVPAIDAQIANVHHSQTLSLPPTPPPPPCCSSQVADNISSITQESIDKNANESKLTETGNKTRSVGRGGGGRRRCYSNQHADTLNLFATNTEEQSAALSDNQTTQCNSAHEQHTTCHSNLTNLEMQTTKINTSKNDNDEDTEEINSSSSSTVNTFKRYAGKMQSDKFHNVTQTSEENAIAFLQDLCSSAVNSETTQRQVNPRKYSDDIVHYAQQLLRQVNDKNNSGSIDIVKQLEKLQRRIASDAFVANSEYKPKSASTQHNMESANAANEINITNCHKQTNNTVSINEHGETKQQEIARANSTRRTSSPSLVPVYVRIAENPQGNYTHYDEFGNAVITTTSNITTANAETNNAHMATKQLEFAARTPTPPPPASLQQTEKSLEEEHKHQKMSAIVNANTSSVECDTIFNAQYPPPPAVGVRSPFFKRKMLVKPILQPYSQSSTTELHEGSHDDNQTQHIPRQTSLSRKAQNNVECMEDYDTLALKRARARAASRSQEQINANDNKESISKDGDDALTSTKRAKVEQANFASDQSADNNTTIATSEKNKNFEDSADHNNKNYCITSKNDHECESDRPRSQRGLLEREMEMKWKAREEAALQHKSGRALTGQNYKKTSLW